MDVGYSVFTCPFMILPAMAGFPLGLDVLLGVPVVVAVYIIMTLFSIVGISVVSLFENRYYLLFGFETNWKYARYPFLALNYFLSLICFIPPLLHVPDQKLALKVLETKHPDIPIQKYADSIFVMSIEHEYILVSMTSISALIFFETVTFGHLLSRNLKKSTEQFSMSQKTYELQKKFLRAIVIQILTPVLILFGPAVYFSFSIINNYYSQIGNNLCIVLIALHGWISTIVMLYIHEPYRKYCIDVFYGALRMKIETTKVVSVTT